MTLARRKTAANAYPAELLERAWARSAANRMPRPDVIDPPASDDGIVDGADDELQWPEEQLEEARRDPAAFCAFVLRDENGGPIANAAHHHEFHRLLSDPANARCALLAFAGSGKTTSITVGRVLWELGHNPNLRVGILCDTSPKAAELVELIGRYIRESEELHAVFPHLRQARKEADPLRKLKGRPVRWTMHSFTVERSARVRDPSVRAAGASKPVQGVRFDLLVVDDLVTWETSNTERARRKLSRWFKSAIAGRLEPGSRVWFLNTAYHPKDLVHEYLGKGYRKLVVPLRDLETKEIQWSRWSPEQLAQRIRDLGGEGSVEVKRQIDCIPSDESTGIFVDDWIRKALKLGDGLDTLPRWTKADAALVPPDAFVLTALDIGIGQTERSAETVLFTLLVFPSGWAEYGLLPDTYQVLAIEAGRWTGPEILERMYEAHDRYQSLVYVESVAAQVWLTQFKLGPRPDGSPRPPPPILPFETRANKWSPTHGVTSLGIDMSQGRWVIPNDGGLLPNEGGRMDPQIAKWIGEILEFSPDTHTGDRLMASWIAREGARRALAVMGGQVEVLG